MTRRPDEIDAVLRQHFKFFVQRCCLHLNPGEDFITGPHIDAIAYHLELVRTGVITRLIINLPPRYLKSIMASVAFPAFVLGHNPKKRIVCLSYGADLSEKHAHDFRSVVRAPFYRKAFPKLTFDRFADSNAYTSQKGYRKTTSVGGALTGFGGQIFVIDDPQKIIDAQSQILRDAINAWFSNTLVSRLDGKATAAIVVVMQRVHLNDLTGYLTELSNDWTVLNLAAIAEDDERILIGPNRFFNRKAGEALLPAYEPIETLKKLRVEMGSEVFAAQYQQSPVPTGGAMLKKEWFRYYDRLPERTFDSKVIQSWDCASKDGLQNDWSVCTTWLVINNSDYYLMSVYRGRVNYPSLRHAAIKLAEHFEPTVILIEDTSAGSALAQELKDLGLYRVVAVPVHRSKQDRLFVEAAKFEAGKVFLPRTATFLAPFETELLQFPQGRHDDQVDSTTQALAFKSGYDDTLSWV